MPLWAGLMRRAHRTSLITEGVAVRIRMICVCKRLFGSDTPPEMLIVGIGALGCYEWSAMPTQWTFRFGTKVDLTGLSRFDVLRAVACGFFGETDGQHDAAWKSFAVRQLGPAEACVGVRLTWLCDATGPEPVVPRQLRLGATTVEVAEATITRPSLAGSAVSQGRRVRLNFTEPTVFRFHGRDLPLPDPYLVYSSLARRLSRCCGVAVDEDAARALSRAVVLYAHDIHTQGFNWHGTTSAGFVGTVTFGLPRAASEAMRGLFATLNGLAVLAGVGHGTTHGLGAVEPATVVSR